MDCMGWQVGGACQILREPWCVVLKRVLNEWLSSVLVELTTIMGRFWPGVWSLGVCSRRLGGARMLMLSSMPRGVSPHQLVVYL